jgi:hypothetical protein
VHFRDGQYNSEKNRPWQEAELDRVRRVGDAPDPAPGIGGVATGMNRRATAAGNGRPAARGGRGFPAARRPATRRPATFPWPRRPFSPTKISRANRRWFFLYLPVFLLTWILEGWVAMAPVGPLRDCQAIVVDHSSSFKSGVFHHCVTESLLAIFETFNILLLDRQGSCSSSLPLFVRKIAFWSPACSGSVGSVLFLGLLDLDPSFNKQNLIKTLISAG